MDGAGRIYVADSSNSRVVRMNDMTGAGWTTLGSWGTGVNQFKSPRGIVVDGAGRIYVTDWGNNRVVRVNDMTGVGWTTLRTSGFPNGIFVDEANRIYVAESLNMFDGHIVRMNDMTGRAKRPCARGPLQKSSSADLR